jgi:pimeloyl-ACP methyl ester carboxylesterase
MAKFGRYLRGMVFAVLLLAVGFVAWCGYLGWQMTERTHWPVGPVPADFPYPVEAVQFPATDGVPLAGWFLPCPGAKQVIVLLHGARRNRLMHLDRAKLLRGHGYAVLLYDARGCGESGGKTISYGFFETKDLLGAMDYLRGRGFGKFGLLGLSQGGVTIVNAARELRDVAWIVLECTPTDLRLVFAHDMYNAYRLPGWLMKPFVAPIMKWRLGVAEKDLIPPRDNIANLHCPLLMIWGGADVRVLPSESREMFARANQPKWSWEIPGAEHISFYPAAGKVYEKALLQFIDHFADETKRSSPL